jgi:hypothetical protein
VEDLETTRVFMVWKLSSDLKQPDRALSSITPRAILKRPDGN